MEKITKWLEQHAPTEIYEVCTIEDLITHLLFYQCDNNVVSVSEAALPTMEKIGKKEKEKLPAFLDAVSAFVQRLDQLLTEQAVKPDAAIVSIQSKWRFQLNELLELQRILAERFSFTPLILMGYADEKKIEISCIMSNGEKRTTQGRRLAFDLDDTLTRWPLFFSYVSKQNCDPDSYHLIISTRYEPVSSSCHQAVYDKEMVEIEKLDVNYDKLVHAWWPFDLAAKLYLCGDDMDWLKRFIWHKVFYCRLHHIDVFYEDQQRNIDLFRKYAADIKVLHVLQNEEPSGFRTS